MLTIIGWIVAGLFFAGIIYIAFVVFFAYQSAKRIAGWAKQEAGDLPRDVAQLRKEVANQNASRGTEQFLKGLFVRWYERLFK